jgi:thioredoxin-like negative regulator of GroEL
VAILVRYRLAADDDQQTPEEPEKTAARVAGALTGDALLAAGDAAAARHAFLAHIAADPDHPAAWAGLGSALAAAGTDRQAAHILRHHPERARSIHLALLRTTGTPPDPLRLATWLGSSPA